MLEDDRMIRISPERSRAVFSQQDFKLIRSAIAHYLKELDDKTEITKYTNLHHRLGRLD